MRRIYLSLFILIIAATCVVSQSVQDEIDRDVWIPFKEAFDNNDAQAQFALHDKNVMRINRDAQYIFVGEEYLEMLLQSQQRNRDRGAVRTIDFSFTERFHTGVHAFDAGYYRVSYAAGGQERITYGYFHAILSKVDGTWKILSDSDTAYDGDVTEEDFFSGVMLRSR